MQQKGAVFRTDSQFVHQTFVKRIVTTLVRFAGYLPIFQDQQVKISLITQQHFQRVSNFDFNTLGQRAERFFHQTAEEVDTFEDALVALFQILDLVVGWQLLHKFCLLFNIGQFLNIRVLLDKVVDFPTQFL